MRLKIWHKMIIGISIPSLLALIGGMLTIGYINDVKNRHGFVEIADDLKEQVLEIRRSEKNLFHYKNAEYFKNVHDAILVFTESISSITPETAEEIGEKDFLLLDESIQTYSSFIDSLYKNYQIETSVTEKVRAEGRKLEAFVAKDKQTGELSTSFILNLRRLEKNYMLFRDKESLLKLRDGLSQLKNIIPFCFKCESYIKSIENLFATYEQSSLLENKLSDNGRKLQKNTDEISSRERQRIGSFITKTKRMLIVGLILLCTIGPFFVYKTASYIVAPIKRLAEITRKISDGDLSLRAPLREHDETYYLSLSFNTMLDHLYLTHQSLEKSLELLHEKQKEIEKRASLGFLISGVTHELNNPLNNISLTAETMKEDLKELTHEELHEYLQDILTQSERAKHIINDLLDFSGSQKSAVMEKIDIINAVGESINLIANELKVNNIDLGTDLPKKVFFVKGHRTKLEEVFVNIMVNAIHSMKDNGALTVSAFTDEKEKNIYIKIIDIGHGIPEEHLKNIFEPFFTTKDVGEGTGLGLSVSQGIINDHNGDISVESNMGMGTIFTIRLPLYDENA